MNRNIAFLLMFLALIIIGVLQSWVFAFAIIQLCLISAIMALGVNIQWGYAGIFNVGIVGFAALGGLSVVLISHPPVAVTIEAGGGLILESAFRLVVVSLVLAIIIRYRKGWLRNLLFGLALVIGYFVLRQSFTPAIALIENTDAALTGFLGGFGLPVLLSWLVGAILAALAAWGIGRATLGLQADYLAIATLGISEVIIAIIKNENWLTRGVKNVTKLPRPVPYELDLQEAPWFLDLCTKWGWEVSAASSIFVKLCYIGLFAAVLIILLLLAEIALASPWGRMVRAIRDNREAASAMGKDVKRVHIQIFIIGSAIVGLAGAMLTTLDGQLVPTAYSPLRFTFLIWVMVIVGGSGNNWGSILGGFFIWILWVEAERLAPMLMEALTYYLPAGGLKTHLVGNAEQLRPVIMGTILILTLRFAPKGLLPEVNR